MVFFEMWLKLIVDVLGCLSTVNWYRDCVNSRILYLVLKPHAKIMYILHSTMVSQLQSFVLIVSCYDVSCLDFFVK